MSTNTQPEPLAARLQELKALGDEIRLNIHLASMDLRDEWKKIEPRLPEAATIAEQLKDSAVEVAHQLGTELRAFRERVRSSTTQPPR